MFRMLNVTAIIAAAAVVATVARAANRIEYPETRRVDHVDEYHGTKVPDPYRWLETDVRESKEVAEWVEAQNKVTFGYLESIPERERIRKRLEELWNYEKYSAPFKAGGRYYFYKNDGLQNQDVLYVMDSLDEEPRVFIDPNTWSEDGTIALAGTAFSDDGMYCAYGIQEAGSDWRTWRVREIASGRLLDDELNWIKYGGVSWTRDGKGFFYSRYDEPQEGAEFQSVNLNQKLYYHRVGTPQSQDVLVYKRPDHPDWGFDPTVTEDGRYLIITVWKGTDDKYRVLYKDLTEPYGMPVDLIDHFENEYTFVGNDGPVFYFKTDLEAPKRRLIAIDIRDDFEQAAGGADASTGEPDASASGAGEPDASASEAGEPDASASGSAEERVDSESGETGRLTPAARHAPAARRAAAARRVREIVPEVEETLTSVSFVANMFVCRYLEDAKTQVKMFTPSGEFVREVEFPGIGSARGFGGKRTYTETFYTFSSFATPPSIYRYDMLTGKSRLMRRSNAKVDPDDYEVKQVFYESKDGTRVPMFISHRKGIELDGSNPTLLYGYGGFNIPLTPYFSISRLAWMEMGGVFAMANLRGGGEYGQTWHQAGTKLNKQNVFDDFIAAAEWLIENDYTRPEKLAIQGGSNGGLLVGAVMTQRPDLFGACLPAVGVMDMLRFHQFTAGRFWVDDYGSAEDPEEFKALYAYSPYHNIEPGTEYPATLVTTADTDDRVVPAHSFKFAARLQHAHKGSEPVLIRIETRAGHGAGKPTSKIIDEIADRWAFLVHELEMELR